ncbi:hypothetical protein F444_04403 [Phytophthora nicotianae P1976]|uniref:Uncharacterized protein n=1 Tax=Phytophthora nicotianae P1976 TaxID=1317066 RepID=A0A081AQT9_PHYNI|nr:hypothetical protein F444_04403 [Phytophthora nicotianae P1976]
MEQSRYKSALVAFMSFKDGVNYSADMNFSEQARLNITPEQLCRWMNHRAYGSEQPTKDMKPTHARSSILEFYKKAISSFIPRLTIPWDNVKATLLVLRPSTNSLRRLSASKSVVRESCPVLDGLLNTTSSETC